MTSMKNLLSPLLAIAALSMGSAHAQKPGDTVTPEVFGKLEWVQGEAPTAWEPGKLYVLECWATWCGPCIAAIPHVDALYDKYAEKGLRVIGVNVWEDGKDKVAEFVKKKGDGMSYPVAYTGKGGAFETSWLVPAGVKGIPHAFLVKDGKVLAGIHPAKLTEDFIEKLLQDGDASKAVLDEMNAQAAKDTAEATARMAFSEATKKGDAEGMAAATAELKKLSPDNLYVPLMENEVLVARKDWSALDTAIASLPGQKIAPLAISSISSTLSKTDDVPVETIKKLITTFEATPELGKGPYPLVTLSRLYWKADDKANAASKAKEAVDSVKATPKMNAVPFEKFAAAIEGGSMPSQEDFIGWMRAEQTAAAGKQTAAVPATPIVPATPAKESN